MQTSNLTLWEVSNFERCLIIKACLAIVNILRGLRLSQLLFSAQLRSTGSTKEVTFLTAENEGVDRRRVANFRDLAISKRG